LLPVRLRRGDCLLRQTPKPKTARAPARPSVPLEPPRQIEIEAPAEEIASAGEPVDLRTGVEGGVEGGVDGGVVGGVVGGISDGILGGVASIPLPPPKVAALGPVRVGGQIDAPALIRRVQPEYPLVARKAMIEGTVILEATVDERGRVAAVDVLRSVGPLTRAAVEAVEQWRYKPLVLNGRAQPFVLTVTLSFNLEDRDG
jgi:protein TonB